jgi:flavodoxin
LNVKASINLMMINKLRTKMNTEIYYFTGTGNSLVVTRHIAEKTQGKLIPVASLIAEKSVKPNNATKRKC